MEYRVLARKYRPTSFADLIGQEVLVRTLTNAIKTGRIAHAFLLTGIRGVGKTTTARIIARALNCDKGPTIEHCGECSQCRMIAEDRHPDVLEMDAASRTGVGDIRELIDTVRYLPSAARYKIYIIDEVHMLSTSAFNALLKTLEEPPPHVKFIFATTESRKIPVTILSRCQRFDLKRVDVEALASHLTNICAKENVQAEPEALKLIAMAAEGSVRDSLSLLDQAIAHAEAGVTAAMVRQMIGMADQTAYFDLLEALLGGKPAEALSLVQQNWKDGADPLLMTQALLEIAHLLTRIMVAPQAGNDVSLTETERKRATTLAGKLSMPVITRLWQMLLKGVQEVKLAPLPLAALEMLLVRIAYAAELPTPGEVIGKEGMRQKALGNRDKVSASPSSLMPNAQSLMPNTTGNLAIQPQSYSQPQPVAQSRPTLQLAVNNVPEAKLEIGSFIELVALFEQHKEMLLYTHLVHDARLVSFTRGEVALKLTAALSKDFIGRVERCLAQWTGEPWKIKLSDERGQDSLADQKTAHKAARMEDAKAHPLVAAVLTHFPGAEIIDWKDA